MINMTSEDIKLIERFEKIMDDGYYVASDDVTRAYNRILNANVPPTNCGSCIRRRINELVNEKNKFKERIKAETAKTDKIPKKRNSKKKNVKEG